MVGKILTTNKGIIIFTDKEGGVEVVCRPDPYVYIRVWRQIGLTPATGVICVSLIYSLFGAYPLL